MSQPSVSGFTAGAANTSMYKVRVPRHLAKKYSVMRFQSTKVDISAVSKAQMSRQTESIEEKESENLPTFGAGSEFGRERREEARKKRRGHVTQPKNPEAAPWNLRIGGKSGRRFTGRKEAGINENSSYYILTQCEDGAFEAVPVNNWYSFTADIKYQTLTADEAEEEFNRRERTVNYFSLMVKKRLADNKDDMEEGEHSDMDKSSKIASRTANLIIHDDERDLSLSEEEDDDEEENQGSSKEDKKVKKDKHKVGQKKQQKAKKGSDADSDVSSGEDAKSKKRPASASKKGTPGEEGSPASKKPRVSPAPSAGGAGGGSRTSTPTPTGGEEGPQGITEEAVRRYLTRKPMTSKDLLQKFKSKRTGLSNDETVKKLAAIVRKIQPEQKTIKGKLYLSLKPQS
ncbi:unnamed protein product [Porites evermanni]|uniref:Transcription initiation factor IIF subunit alpha n=1 Tax=Porites evermanni TaxID=104178 RepID=A0ABN8T3E9_9CNID|nr:unnamed protein product [Porites evermanni]